MVGRCLPPPSGGPRKPPLLDHPESSGPDHAVTDDRKWNPPACCLATHEAGTLELPAQREPRLSELSSGGHLCPRVQGPAAAIQAGRARLASPRSHEQRAGESGAPGSRVPGSRARRSADSGSRAPTRPHPVPPRVLSVSLRFPSQPLGLAVTVTAEHSSLGRAS